MAVLNRNNSEDRLEPTTPLAEESSLAGPLASASPRDCLAVRLARPFESSDPMAALAPVPRSAARCRRGRPASRCSSAARSSGPCCSPPRAARRREQRRLTIGRPGGADPRQPRNLALAEARAATDALTGCRTGAPCRHAQTHARPRRAHASPLAVVLLDLDHFKQINDTYGHDEGRRGARRRRRRAGRQRPRERLRRPQRRRGVHRAAPRHRRATGALGVAEKLRGGGRAHRGLARFEPRDHRQFRRRRTPRARG